LINAISKTVYLNRLSLLFLYVIILILSLLNVSNIRVDSNLIELLDQDQHEVKQYKYFNDNFKGSDSFVLLFETDVNDEASLKHLTKKLNKLDLIDSISHYMPPEGLLPESRHEKSSIILVTPTFKPTDMNNSKIMSRAIQLIADDMGLNIGLTGSYQVVIETAESITADMLRSAIITFAAICLILLFMMRIPLSFVIGSLLTILLGLFITLWSAEIFFGRLTFMTAALPAVLLGLGVDFCLHIIYAFSNKAVLIRDSSDFHDVLSQKTALIASVYTYTLKPMGIGAVTTAGAFLVFVMADSEGLNEMGLFGASGIIIMFLCASIFLPVFLCFFDIKVFNTIKRTDTLWTSIFNFLNKKTIVLFCATTGLVLLLLPFAFFIRFTSDQNTLLDKNLTSFSLQSKLLNGFHFFPVPLSIVSPDKKTDQDKLKHILTVFSSEISFIRSHSLAIYQGRNPAEFIGKDGSFVSHIYSVVNPFAPDGFHKIRSLTDKVNSTFPGPGNFIAGSPFLNNALNETLKNDFLKCLIFTFVCIALIIYFFFRNVKEAVFALIPVTLSLLLTAGLMGVLKIDFNLMTIVIFPLIVGAGIDDGVHILWRWKKENKNVTKTLQEISNPITATSVTTCAAFASLLFSSNPGFRELGLVSMCGLMLCLIITLSVLPPLLFKINLKDKGDI